MIHEIETSKGKFGVVENPILPQSLSITSKYIKLSEITENEASDIVENHETYTDRYKDYLYDKEYIYSIGEKHSLWTLLESHNIEITNNTYIFNV